VNRFRGGSGNLGRESVVVDFPPAVLVAEVLVQLAVVENLTAKKRVEVEAAKPLPQGGILTAMDSPQAGEKPAVSRVGGLGHVKSFGPAWQARIMAPNGLLRQAPRGRIDKGEGLP
jgi:hypothetical protein